jgi:hypothetical protein
MRINELRSWQLQGLSRTRSAYMALGSLFDKNNRQVSIIVEQILRPVAARINDPQASAAARLQRCLRWFLHLCRERRLDEWRWACIRVWEMFGEKVYFSSFNFHESPLFLPQLQNRTNYLPQLFKPCILPPRNGFKGGFATVTVVCYSKRWFCYNIGFLSFPFFIYFGWTFEKS